MVSGAIGEGGMRLKGVAVGRQEGWARRQELGSGAQILL
jgi:hypothetical protein